MRRTRFLPVFLASFAVSVALLAPGAFAAADLQTGTAALILAITRA